MGLQDKLPSIASFLFVFLWILNWNTIGNETYLWSMLRSSDDLTNIHNVLP